MNGPASFALRGLPRSVITPEPNVPAASNACAELAHRSGLTAATLAVAFVHSRWFCASTIVGATSVAQLMENIDSKDVSLADSVLAEIAAIHVRYPNPAI